MLRPILAAALALSGGAGRGGVDGASVLDGGDPTLIEADGRYRLYVTSGGTALSSWSSKDLMTWRADGPLLRQSEIGWIGDDGAPRHSLWAPDMVRANRRWYFYYSVGPQTPTPSRLGVATCDGPAGPCRDSGRPLLTGGKGFEAIDPMVFRDPASGRAYLYAGGSAGATLRVFELGSDMTTLAREVAVDQPPHFTEGAFMHERHGTYYLSYSHGKWNDASYQVHYATAQAPTGPWRYRGVLLKSDARYRGPGHHSFLHARDGRWLIAYHRWEGKSDDGPYRGTRRIAIQPVTYAADGEIVPVVMTRR